jgi:tRNA(adenine34) deaminase
LTNAQKSNKWKEPICNGLFFECLNMSNSLDEFFMRQALALAEEATSLGEIPVAALIVKDEQIIARAHNRRELDKDPTAHAEILAIQEASRIIGDWRLEGCTLYVTLEPCAMCSGALWLARFDRVVFGAFDPKSGFLGSIFDISDPEQTEKMNHHFQVCSGVLEEESVLLLQTFFREIRTRKKAKKLAEKECKE